MAPLSSLLTVAAVAALFVGAVARIDPEVYMDATESITSKGFPCENHWVTTKDGFILNLQRIPHGRAGPKPANGTEKPVVILQHGFLGSSLNWLDNLANESLAYILADAGADVWLGNIRGNQYSTNHTSLNKTQKEFWDWTWDEMAAYDLPATIDYVLAHTNVSQVHYAGHSQGTCMGFAGFSSNKTLASLVKRFYAFAPIARMRNMKSPIRLFSPFAKNLIAFYELFGFYDWFPSDPALMDFLARYVCDDVSDALCSNVFFLLGGFDRTHFNESRVPVWTAHNPSGTSVKNLLQFAQANLVDVYQKFDYGSPEANKAKYNQTTPPQYDLSKFQVPTVLYTAGNDWLADPKDVAWLAERINQSVIDTVHQADWEHMDFIWAKDAPSLVYDNMIKYVFKK